MVDGRDNARAAALGQDGHEAGREGESTVHVEGMDEVEVALQRRLDVRLCNEQVSVECELVHEAWGYGLAALTWVVQTEFPVCFYSLA